MYPRISTPCQRDRRPIPRDAPCPVCPSRLRRVAYNLRRTRGATTTNDGAAPAKGGDHASADRHACAVHLLRHPRHRARRRSKATGAREALLAPLPQRVRARSAVERGGSRRLARGFLDCKEQNAELVSFADTEMAHLYQQLAGSGHSIILTDREGSCSPTTATRASSGRPRAPASCSARCGASGTAGPTAWEPASSNARRSSSTATITS